MVVRRRRRPQHHQRALRFLKRSLPCSKLGRCRRANTAPRRQAGAWSPPARAAADLAVVRPGKRPPREAADDVDEDEQERQHAEAAEVVAAHALPTAAVRLAAVARELPPRAEHRLEREDAREGARQVDDVVRVAPQQRHDPLLPRRHRAVGQRVDADPAPRQRLVLRDEAVGVHREGCRHGRQPGDGVVGAVAAACAGGVDGLVQRVLD